MPLGIPGFRSTKKTQQDVLRRQSACSSSSTSTRPSTDYTSSVKDRTSFQSAQTLVQKEEVAPKKAPMDSLLHCKLDKRSIVCVCVFFFLLDHD